MRTGTAGWVAVVGSRSDGREDVLRACGRALAERGIALGGFVQTPWRQGEALAGYDVVSMATSERVALARDSPSPALCNWGFDDDAFARARRWTLEGPHTVAFLEAGRLEAAERGHWPTIVESLRTRPLTVLGIRRTVLAAVALRLPDPVDALELPASSADVARFIDRLARSFDLAVSA